MTFSKPLILLVDDDPGIRELLGDFLTKEGFAVETAADADAMDTLLARIHPDMIVLDLMLPGEDGVSICRRLTRDGGPPIIMLTAKNDEIDRILGLEMGAYDYVAKPFAPRELLARIRAVLRRSERPQPKDVNDRRAFDRFIIDLDARQLLTTDDQRITLTSGEFDLLDCFVNRPRRVLSRGQILDALRGRGAEPFDRTVDMIVSRLRRKLSAHGAVRDLISTARNAGYLLTSPVKRLP